MNAQVSQNFTDLQAEVAQDTDVMSSAVTTIDGIAAQLAAALQASQNGDTAALPNLLSSLQSARQPLAAAIAANTPAAPAAGN